MAPLPPALPDESAIRNIYHGCKDAVKVFFTGRMRLWYGNIGMDFEYIIDSHTHWGPSLSMGTLVTTAEITRQQKESGVTHTAIMPFPSTAIADNSINVDVLKEAVREKGLFIPYHYIREGFEEEGFDPVPKEYYGGKWHWMRGWQDTASNYEVLRDAHLPRLLDTLKTTGKPIIFEEELSFTERLIDMAEGITFIIPHLGMLGGNPLDFLRTFKDKSSVFFDTALSAQDTLLKFVETVGADRILFGSDIPFGTMRAELIKILALPVSEEDKEKMVAGNFRRLTGWRPPIG